MQNLPKVSSGSGSCSGSGSGSGCGRGSGSGSSCRLNPIYKEIQMRTNNARIK